MAKALSYSRSLSSFIGQSLPIIIFRDIWSIDLLKVNPSLSKVKDKSRFYKLREKRFFSPSLRIHSNIKNLANLKF